MVSSKILSINVNKAYDYLPVGSSEKDRLQKILIAELIELTERFDGPVKVEIIFQAKGNI